MLTHYQEEELRDDRPPSLTGGGEQFPEETFQNRNLIHDNRRLVAPFLERLERQRSTSGICLLGSTALGGFRPFSDQLSDIDVALFVSIPESERFLHLEGRAFFNAIQPHLPPWLPNFKFRLPDAVAGERRGIEVNVHQLVLEYEERPDVSWQADRREAFRHTCDVVYDPTGRVSTLIREKCPPNAEEIRQRLCINLSRIPILLSHGVEKCIHRKLIVDAHLELNDVVEKLLELTFDLNQRDMPDKKWRLSVASRLPILPSEFSQRLTEAVQVRELTPHDVRRRSAAVLHLFADLSAYAHTHALVPKNHYGYMVSQLREGWQLAHQTAADKSRNDLDDQYARMDADDWNSFNFDLRE